MASQRLLDKGDDHSVWPKPRMRTVILSLIITIFTVYPTRAENSTRPEVSGPCVSSCGDNKPVQFPFGFSASCPIRLNCNNSKIRIGEFPVLNVTSDSIFLDFPQMCNRTIQSISPLFGNNFAPTRRNNLLLHNCTTQQNDCVVPAVRDRFNWSSCDGPSDNISCFPAKLGERVGFLGYKNVTATKCQLLLSSIVVDSSQDKSAVSLMLQRVELGWWLDGQCQCSDDSECVKVTKSDGKQGFRCHCNSGYRGDGFKGSGAEGCRKVPHCNPSRYLSGKCGGPTRVVVLIGGIVAGASVMAGLFLICSYVRRRSSCLKSQMSAKRLLYDAAGTSSVPLYPYREIERATNCFSEKQMLGTGAFGTVYAGKFQNDEWVAVKKIKYRDTNSIDQVLNEIKLLSSVSHPNLVRLLGCCIEEGEQILVYEYMPNGTLSQHLQRERSNGLPWTIRLTIASETANAIAYLHSAMNPPIYHRDIKSSNILLDHSFKSKVADFGLSRLGLTESSHISTAPQGTPGYVDPQYHQNFHLSDKSDVYSFGVVLVEIITALKVVDFTRPHSEVNLAALAIDRIGRGCIDDIVDPFLEPNRDAWTLYSVHKIAELAFRCLAFHSDMRPSMMEVAEELEHIRRSGWATFEENICMASSAVSSCSSPRNGSEKSFGGIVKAAGAGSQRSIVSEKADGRLALMEEVKDSSPVSVHDPWFSDQSSPSTNSLLGNVVR
ncbi:wall-associated receptor kinase-like 14 isoform X2 [Alnus glutinosa]|uniref:wall-associated receptor kinase-like 14 isoform X2 n=1 Tax=Alnus glutinosa TaxID=3517 RepID=UPI002D76F0C3|nr:wall-associated receptor kinase-like 14 isoform X2 [Alnus glutinosa]